MSEEVQTQDPLTELKENSRQFGANLIQFLDTIKLSAASEQQRQAMQIFIKTSEIVEKIATGELVVVQSEALGFVPDEEDETPEEDGEE